MAVQLIPIIVTEYHLYADLLYDLFVISDNVLAQNSFYTSWISVLAFDYNTFRSGFANK
jgi:hypothetical protein